MTAKVTDGETILIVEDEEPVRRTFLEWLRSADPAGKILTASDAESALLIADKETIDLAILDWNLGAGNDGLQLLEDLTLFNPDIIAILVTGFAHQATPLQAMRMGVRDYLDKNQQLDRATFLRAVQRQLDLIRPARRERKLHQQLLNFRSTVEKILPLVQTASALADPLPLPAAVSHLFAFLLKATRAAEGVLLASCHHPDRVPADRFRVFGPDGHEIPLPTDAVPFQQSLAGNVISMQQPCMINESLHNAGVPLQSFEQNRRSVLLAPLTLGQETQVVLELFDKPGGFDQADRQLVAAAAEFAGELFRQALAGHQTHRILFDAVEAALGASDQMAATLNPGNSPEQPTPRVVLDRLRDGLQEETDGVNGEDTVRLAEAVRQLAVRHGPLAVQHCLQLIESVRVLLDQQAGIGGVDS